MLVNATGFIWYTIGGTVITSCYVVRDLGIQVGSHIKFHELVIAVIKKVNQLLSILHKSFQYFDKATFINLY